MGDTEVGTGNLTVRYEGLNVAIATTVDFFDGNKQVISTDALNLIGLGLPFQPRSRMPAPRHPTAWCDSTVRSTCTVQAATYRPDSDGDGLPDAWEITFGLNPLVAGMNPVIADTDGLPDRREAGYSLNPLDPTSLNGGSGNPDNDGLTGTQELAASTNPVIAHTGSDGLPEGGKQATASTHWTRPARTAVAATPMGTGRATVRN